MKKKRHDDSANIADTYYQPELGNHVDDLPSGLAATHEQVNHAYMEGEIDKLVKAGGKNRKQAD
ncbi:MAG: YozQ family protein [Bacillales bacterium]